MIEFTPEGAYANAALSPLEQQAVKWLDGFYQLEHLLCTRMWAMKLTPEASAEVKFASLVHDAERFFPGGPPSTPGNGFDDPDYLFAHSTRSANIVEEWLRARTPAPEDNFIRRVRHLILRHEIGGGWEADFVQAADSLSFLDSLDWITVDWVKNGYYTIAGAREKLDYTVERIRPSNAIAAALPLYESAVCALDAAHESGHDLKKRREIAGSRRYLLGLGKVN
ncbi:MAG: hypothetical protein CMM54_04995 [Rhodospirillaceae bacterium]|nr:hypothetical protein [Rhodospirillaceae bacterium]|tara:strand:+ start:3157 stop:3828 length:672 start_codon:yes stop_codon:yes gene_type:complete